MAWKYIESYSTTISRHISTVCAHTQCTCYPRYTGERCEFKIDDRNAATAATTTATTTTTTTAAADSATTSTAADPSTPQECAPASREYCLHGGRCRRGPRGPQCACAAGWRGARCDLRDHEHAGRCGTLS